MEFELKIAGHLFYVMLLELSADLQYFVIVDELSFKMVRVEDSLRIVNPDNVASWVVRLEDHLSDSILSRLAQAA